MLLLRFIKTLSQHNYEGKLEMLYKKLIISIALLFTFFILSACSGNIADENEKTITENLNEEYRNIIQIQCYENYDPSTNTSSFAPNSEKTDGLYMLSIGNTGQTMNYRYSGHKYYGPLGPGKYSVDAEYKVDKFYEISDLILTDEIQNYEYSFDQDGKIVSSPENYYFIIQYISPTTGEKIYKAIKTPSQTDQIVAIFDDILVSNAKYENLLHLDDQE